MGARPAPAPAPSPPLPARARARPRTVQRGGGAGRQWPRLGAHLRSAETADGHRKARVCEVSGFPSKKKYSNTNRGSPPSHVPHPHAPLATADWIVAGGWRWGSSPQPNRAFFRCVCFSRPPLPPPRLPTHHTNLPHHVDKHSATPHYGRGRSHCFGWSRTDRPPRSLVFISRWPVRPRPFFFSLFTPLSFPLPVLASHTPPAPSMADDDHDAPVVVEGLRGATVTKEPGSVNG